MRNSIHRAIRPVVRTLESRVMPAVYSVTTFADTADPGSGSSGLSLRAAIVLANATPEADTIVLPAGRYTLALAGRDESAGRTGDLNIVGNLTIQGAGASTTVIDANGIDRAIAIGANGSQESVVSISGIAVTGGRTVAGANIDSGLPDGAGILVVGSTLNLSASVVTANASGREGGGIAVRDSRLNATASTIFANSAGRDGGGISLSGGNDPTRTANVSLVNATVSDNTAVRSGGGIKLFSPDGTRSILTAVNVTLFGNGAASGGNLSNTVQNALKLGGAISLTNTIVAGAPTGGNYDSPQGVTSLGGNLEDADTLKLRRATDQFSTDAGLGPLRNNGGTTPTRAPSAGSAARDRAITALAPATDQIGTPRPQGSAADVGAFEASPTTAGRPPAFGNLPTATNSTARLTAVGAGRGSSQVNVYNSDGAFRTTLNPFDGFGGGVRVATGDFNGDGTDDIIVGAGSGGGPHVKVFDGKTFAEIASFFAFDTAFVGGVEVAAGDLDGDGKSEIVVAAGPGGGPHVKVFRGGDMAVLASFYAFDPQFRGGVSAGIDGIARTLIVGAGPGGGPEVGIYDGSTFALRKSFLAFDAAYTGGVSLAAIDNVIAVGMFSPSASGVRLFSPSGAAIGGFQPFESAYAGGVRLAVGGTAVAPVFLVGAAGKGGPVVRAFSTSGTFDSSLLAFDPAYDGGVTVG